MGGGTDMIVVPPLLEKSVDFSLGFFEPLGRGFSLLATGGGVLGCHRTLEGAPLRPFRLAECSGGQVRDMIFVTLRLEPSRPPYAGQHPAAGEFQEVGCYR
jgi:hypothetical protein